MPISSILIGVALTLVVVPFVVGPLIERRRQPAGQNLLAASSAGVLPPGTVKHKVLTALRDLDFDYSTGKVAAEDYAPLRAELLAQAADALQAEDGRRPRNFDAEIEAAVRAVRSGGAPPPAGTQVECPQCQTLAFAGNKFCRQCGTTLGVTCPKCHQAVAAGNHFCGHCGQPL
jgi:hypothetical protein